MIKKEGDKYVLYSKDGSKKLGEFKTEEEAKAREKQILMFKERGQEAMAVQLGILPPEALQAVPSEVQMLVFSKDKFKAPDEAKAWARERGFKIGDVEDAGSTMRMKQKETTEFIDGSLKPMDIDAGVQAVIGRKKTTGLSQLALGTRGRFQPQGDLFGKDILHIGTYVHPSTGEKVEFDKGRLSRLVRNTNRFIAAGNDVTFPDGHSLRAMDNLGKWPGPFFEYGGRLGGVVKPAGETVKQRLSDGRIDRVSAYIQFGIKDPKGNEYDEVITHVCATPVPVVTEQGPFVKLSTIENADGTVQGLMPLVPEEELAGKGAGMDWKKLALALGIKPDGLSEEKLQEACTKALEERDQQEKDRQQKLSVALSTHGLKLEGDQVVKVEKPSHEPKPGDDPEKAAMKQELARLSLQAAKDRLAQAKADAQKAVADGRVPPDQAERLSKLFTIAEKAEFVALSKDGAEVQRTTEDALSILREFVNGLPVLTGTHLQLATGGTGGQTEESRLQEVGRKLARKHEGRDEDGKK